MLKNQPTTNLMPLHLTKSKIPNVPIKMRISYIEFLIYEKSRINSNLKKVEKEGENRIFKTFFLILKLDIKKCPKWILKKKF